MLRRLPFGRDGGPPNRRPPPRPSKRRPPPPPDLSAVASFTRRFRPPSSAPSSFWIASAALSGVTKVTNAKPRGRPLSRSRGRKTSEISPIGANSASNSSFVVLKLKLPTKTLLTDLLAFSCCAVHLHPERPGAKVALSFRTGGIAVG